MSHITSANLSPNLRSPVQDYTMRSPEYGQGLVESQVKSSTEQPSRFMGDSRSFGLTESGHSGAISRQTAGYDGGRSGAASGIATQGQSGLASSGLKPTDSQIRSGLTAQGGSQGIQGVQGAQPSASRYQAGGQSTGASGLAQSGLVSGGTGAITGSGASYQSGTGATYQSASGYPPSGPSTLYGAGLQTSSGLTSGIGASGLGSGTSYTSSAQKPGSSTYGASLQGGQQTQLGSGQIQGGGSSSTQQGSGSTQQGGSSRFGGYNYPNYK